MVNEILILQLFFMMMGKGVEGFKPQICDMTMDNIINIELSLESNYLSFLYWYFGCN